MPSILWRDQQQPSLFISRRLSACLTAEHNELDQEDPGFAYANSHIGETCLNKCDCVAD